MKVLTAIYLDKRRIKSNNTYPLKLRVSQQQERRYYSIGVDITEDDWKKVNSTSSNSELKKIRAKIIQIIDEVDSLIKDIGGFTFAKFEILYLKKESKNARLEEAFSAYITQLNKEGRVSTAECDANAKSSLLDFKNSLQLGKEKNTFYNWHVSKSITYHHEHSNWRWGD